MAIASAIAIGGAIISAFDVVDVVKNYAFSIAKEEFKSVWYLKNEINKISELVVTIQGVVEDAEKKQLQDEDVRKWIRDLKNAGYDMEDVLCDYRVVVSAEDGHGVLIRWMREAKDSLYLVCGIPLSCLNIIAAPVTPRIEIAHRLKSINRTLVEINQRKAKLSLVQHSGGGSNESDPTMSRETSSLEDRERPMIGRNELKTQIKEALLNSSRTSTKGPCSKLSIVCIVGVGGMGKTTLAQNIYNDKAVTAAFPLRKWLYVGDKFDYKRLMNRIIGSSSQNGDLNDLHSKVTEKLEKQSFLIVLDDAWCTNGEEWELFLRPLSQGEKEGAIIVTARYSAVAKAIPHGQQYSELELERMSDADCMEIFKRWAFMGQKVQRYPDLERLSDQLVQKLKGVPLAATILGRFLHKHLDNQHMWISITNDVGWPHTNEGNVVDRMVGLSYLHLPLHLKPCFAYCAMFPKGFKFDKETMVQMWVAQGYVQPRGNELMEHTGSAYFNDLCQRSFFQLWTRGFYSDHYIMHDLIHDFAQKVFTEGCWMGANHTEDGTLSEEIRHLSFYYNKTEPPELTRLHKFKKLRTLRLEQDPGSFVSIFPTLDVLAEFKYLRLLLLHGDRISGFPVSIQHMQFLQYLDISRTRIRALPEVACDLVNLLVLKLPHICALPKGMNKLINLRFLEANDEEITHVRGIGQLTSLQGRVTFKVQNKSGWKISELKGLNHLHGKLVVRGLWDVTCKEEAEQAFLKDKVHLEELVLDWGVEKKIDSSIQRQTVVDSQVQEHVTNDVQTEVLEGLSPPPYLKALTIKDYLGARFPSWMDEHHCPISSSLKTLELYGCCKWGCLPTLGRLPSLTKLTIARADSVKKIGSEFYGEIDNMHGRGNNNNGSYFPCLEILEFMDMSLWEEWEMPAGEIDSGAGHLFPSLKKLCIKSCPKLLTLHPVLRHLTNLKEFEIFECPKLPSSAMLRHLSALECLKIEGCDELVLDRRVAEDEAEGTISGVQQPVVYSQVDQEEHGTNDVVERQVVEGQPPSPYLNESLTGLQLPSWVVKHHCPLLSTLVTLRLGGCCTWECLPTLGQLPSLTILIIEKADNVRKIGPEFYGETDVGGRVYFPRLQFLSLNEMSSWEGWGTPAGVTDGGGGQHVFPSLKQLCIYLCPKLPSLSPVLRHLTKLERILLWRCDELESLEEGDGCGWMYPSLEVLTICECPKLASLSPILRHSTNLERIKIRKCAELALFKEGDGCGWMLPSGLKELTIDDSSPKLPSLSQMLPHLTALQVLEMCGFRNLQCVPPSVRNLRCLRILRIWDSPAIECLPDGGLPPSLEQVFIMGCPLLEGRCREGGPDRPKIPTTTCINLPCLPESSTADDDTAAL